jgi:hypothetical protein
MRVLAAMSGGVDSSVAALLLQRQGHEVVGVFMRNGVAGKSAQEKSCCSASDARDAALVADRLGMAFYAVDYAQEFAALMDHFAAEYRSGTHTEPLCVVQPAPQIRPSFSLAADVGAEAVATGHYARVVDGELRTARDAARTRPTTCSASSARRCRARCSRSGSSPSRRCGPWRPRPGSSPPTSPSRWRSASSPAATTATSCARAAARAGPGGSSIRRARTRPPRRRRRVHHRAAQGSAGARRAALRGGDRPAKWRRDAGAARRHRQAHGVVRRRVALARRATGRRRAGVRRRSRCARATTALPATIVADGHGSARVDVRGAGRRDHAGAGGGVLRRRTGARRRLDRRRGVSAAGGRSRAGRAGALAGGGWRMDPRRRAGSSGGARRAATLAGYRRCPSAVPARKPTVRDALIWIGSLVCGLRPMRALRFFTAKVPKPTIWTSLSFFRPFWIDAISALTARSACALLHSVPSCFWTSWTRVCLVHGCPPGEWQRAWVVAQPPFGRAVLHCKRAKAPVARVPPRQRQDRRRVAGRRGLSGAAGPRASFLKSGSDRVDVRSPGQSAPPPPELDEDCHEDRGHRRHPAARLRFLLFDAQPRRRARSSNRTR